MSWLLAFTGFAALIVLHEFGHFVAAKAVGMRVERFSLFFGPMLVKVRRGETEYGIGPIPLGGYVKITGMNPREELAPDVARRGYFAQPVWKRVAVIVAGPLVNVLLAFVILALVYLVNGDPVARHATDRIAAVEAHQPASGRLQVGDRIVAIDGRRAAPAQISQEIARHRCTPTQTAGCSASTPVGLTVRRGARLLQLSLVPRYDPAVRRTRIGFAFNVTTLYRPTDVASAARLGVEQMWHITSITVSNVAGLFYSAKARDQIHGVVGGYEQTRQAFRFSTTEAFFILGLISLSLAIINLFPFLPLDGGHVFWALAEKVRGRAIPFSVMERASAIGIALVLFVAFIGLSNDVTTLQHGGFGVR